MAANSSASRRLARGEHVGVAVSHRPAPRRGPRLGGAVRGPVPAQRVARAPDGLEPHAAARLVQLAPQPADVHVDDVGEGVELVVPRVVEDPVAAEDLVRVQQEEPQQAELLGAQHEQLAAVPGHPRRRVEAERPQRQDGRQRALRPAQKRADARQQFFEGERLDQVVVGAGVQAGHLVRRRVPRRQHEHGQGHALLTQLPAEREPVHAREHDVEDQEVVGQLALRLAGAGGAAPGREAAARGGSVEQHVHCVTLGLESRLEGSGQLLGIFHDQDAHSSASFGRHVTSSLARDPWRSQLRPI